MYCSGGRVVALRRGSLPTFPWRRLHTLGRDVDGGINPFLFPCPIFSSSCGKKGCLEFCKLVHNLCSRAGCTPSSGCCRFFGHERYFCHMIVEFVCAVELNPRRRRRTPVDRRRSASSSLAVKWRTCDLYS